MRCNINFDEYWKSIVYFQSPIVLIYFINDNILASLRSIFLLDFIYSWIYLPKYWRAIVEPRSYDQIISLS